MQCHFFCTPGGSGDRAGAGWNFFPHSFLFPLSIPWPLQLSPDLSTTQDGFFHISKHHPKYNNQNESEKNKSMPTSSVCVCGEENSFGEQNLCIIYV